MSGNPVTPKVLRNLMFYLFTLYSTFLYSKKELSFLIDHRVAKIQASRGDVLNVF